MEWRKMEWVRNWIAGPRIWQAVDNGIGCMGMDLGRGGTD
jgi:hypothetical protein